MTDIVIALLITLGALRLTFGVVNDAKPDWPVGGNCIGSRCMAWHWDGIVSDYSNRPDQRPGHCGLAGKP